MKIVFMGTPNFAATALQELLNEELEIAAVYTQPDKPQGRKMKMTAPPVKELALHYNLPILQPKTLKDEEVTAQMQEISPDLIIVVAYGKILPPEILHIPSMGCVNLHASLLPKYRGAAPIQRAILAGEKETGVTTMFMDEGLDTGDILLQEKVLIAENENSIELFDKMAHVGAKLLVKTIYALSNKSITPILQDSEKSSYAAMITKEEGCIDFCQSAQKIHNIIRGLSGWPIAYAYLGNKKLKIHQSVLLNDLDNTTGNPGELVDTKRCIIQCQDGAIELLKVQLEGGKVMSGKDFLNGRKMKMGEILKTEKESPNQE